jgi:L-serine dehydratase
MITLYPEFFNDVFGPVMQPGSSSHLAGPCRLGWLARSLLGEELAEVEFIMDPQGSFAGTFGLMSEDVGMLGGALGMLPHDPRLFEARRIADASGVKYRFRQETLPESSHPNALKIILTGKSGLTVSLVGDSIGGGMVVTRRVEGFPLETRGDAHVLLIFDPGRQIGGETLQSISDGLSGKVDQGQLASDESGQLYYYRLSAWPDLPALQRLLPGIRIARMQAILPVVTSAAKRPQLFDTMTGWRELAAERGWSLAEAAIQYEMAASGWGREDVIAYMKELERKMYRQTHAVYQEPEQPDQSPFTRRDDRIWPRYQERNTLAGPVLAEAVRLALGVNRKQPGVEIVPGPMGTGGGYLYAALCAVREAHGFGEEDLLRGLFVAAGVGAIAYTRTAPTGEVIGCAGECGVCGAMAAAAITEMASGTPLQVEQAASLMIQAMMGLPCDPIPGGFEQPCLSRILSAVCMAIVYADLALAGGDAVLPFHEALDAADRIGRSLAPELRCTSTGGCCATPTGQRQITAFHRWFKSVVINPVRRPG